MANNYDFEDDGGPRTSVRSNSVGEASFFGNEFEVMETMNKLYDVLRDVNHEGFDTIHLPRLVVCGDQSHGKTSVFEGIVKRELLPKGENIQTRCPIEVRLRHISGDSRGFANILNEDDTTWTALDDIQKVQKVIQERTDTIKQTCPAGVTDKKITVEIYSPDVPDLTLVDLPGFLNVNTEGQSENIITSIKNVVRNEISNPNSIILAVTAANNNIGTSMALREALKVDPNRERTLGVMTKLDLMDLGTNCEDVLNGKEYKLKLGFVGVVNRNFEDNSKKMSIEEKLIEEKQFLEKHYPKIANKHGTPFLTKTISHLLLQRIYSSLPSVKVNIEKLIQTNKEKLEGFGPVMEPAERRNVLLTFLEKFRDAFKAQIDGTRRYINTDELAASAKIQDIYRNLLMNDRFELMEGVSDLQIDQAIKNSHGLHNIMAKSVDDAFQLFARTEVGRLRAHVINCVDRVNAEMTSAIQASCDDEADKYPKLNHYITWVASDVINENYQKCKNYMETFIDAEGAMVYSSDLDFLQKLKAPRAIGQNPTSNPAAAAQKDKTDDSFYGGARVEVKLMVQNYFELVKKRVQDHCPKAISHLLVYQVLETVGKELNLRLDTVEHVKQLMQESATVQTERAVVDERLQKYTNARDIINEVLKTAA